MSDILYCPMTCIQFLYMNCHRFDSRGVLLLFEPINSDLQYFLSFGTKVTECWPGLDGYHLQTNVRNMQGVGRRGLGGCLVSKCIADTPR